MQLSDAVVALGQVSVPSAPGLGSLSQYGPLGIIAGALLGLFGLLFKKLIDNVLKQNAIMQAQQLTKLDEIRNGLFETKTALVLELGATKTVINQLSADVVQELEALRADVDNLNPRRSTTDTPLPQLLPRRRQTMPPGGVAPGPPGQPMPRPPRR